MNGRHELVRSQGPRNKELWASFPLCGYTEGLGVWKSDSLEVQENANLDKSLYLSVWATLGEREVEEILYWAAQC